MSDIYLSLAKQIRTILYNEYGLDVSVDFVLKRLADMDEDEIVLCSATELAEEILQPVPKGN